ncbi:MAG: hypothetical protein ACKN9V_03770 [Pseudomonadota bacterium]
MKIKILLAMTLFLAASLRADTKTARWTGQEDRNSEFTHVLSLVNQKTGLQLNKEDFSLLEERPLATSRFVMYAQKSGDVPIHGQVIRIWSRLDNQETIQVEAHVDEPISEHTVRLWSKKQGLDSRKTIQIVKNAIQNLEDNEIRDIRWKDEWLNRELVRSVRVKARRGVHRISISIDNKRIVESKYQPFPFSEQYFSLSAQVYPLWEEYENVPANLNGRVASELKFLKTKVREAGVNPYEALQQEMKYLESKFDPIKGLTEEGRKEGFWAMSYVKNQASQIYEKLPLVSNSFKTGVILEGKYTSVNFHPSVLKLSGINFDLKRSSQFRPNWIVIDQATESMEMIPESGVLGRPLLSSQDAYSRLARRLPDHSVVDYINDGFDEVQVYWAVTQLFESLRPMGFTDPELSTRPFHAYLYDTDIAMKDNAYYTDDTINFTTYSGHTHNMARDNTTIWHELGHGVMDRLMGDHLVLADTGGLSEGIADFVADLVIRDVTKGKDFVGSDQLRILNRTGFNLTNESHDDGEAYGGTLHDILVKAMEKDGLLGLKKVTDLTLEAMRLTRNHPELTAQDWFSHVLFADELGNLPLRKPGELKVIIEEALAGRNFSLEGLSSAEFKLLNGQQEIHSDGFGSRALPIPVKLSAQESKDFQLRVQLKSSETYAFKYPVIIKVQLRQGPIQGAIRWKDESDEPHQYLLRSEEDTALIPLSVSGTCDEVNRPDGSCVDYAYVQIWNDGEKEEAQAKKRFYLRVIPQR